jgi:hypothetical protein
MDLVRLVRHAIAESAEGGPMKRLIICCFVLTLWLTPSVATADGGPVAELPGTGIIVPVHLHDALLLDQIVTITIARDAEYAVIRAEYQLALGDDVKKPLTVVVGWPSQGILRDGVNVGTGTRTETYPRSIPYIKLDGKPVAYHFLSADDLAAQYLAPMMQRRDQLLDSKPDLRAKVQETREQARGEGGDWLLDEGIDALAQWLRAIKLVDVEASHIVARGLVTARPSYDDGEAVERALAWLDPFYEVLDYQAVLSHRWGFEEVMLDAHTGRLTWGRCAWAPHDLPDYALFRFPITLLPGKKHKLVVQYCQYPYEYTSGPPSGWTYLTESLRSWGLGNEGTIEVRVPVSSSTRRVAILPRARKVGVKDGYAVYRIARRSRLDSEAPLQPFENVYVSVGD